MGELTLYKPHPKQLDIHTALESEGFKYCVVSIGRQFGKTILAENQALKWAVENDSVKVGWISPTYKQCKKVFKELVLALDNWHGIESVNHSDLIIKVNNGSQIIFYSAEAYDTIRGETFDYLIGDEVAFWKPEAWNEVIKATVLVRGKKVLLLSTPKGKNLFHTLFNLSQSNDAYRSYTGTSYDNPFIDPSEIEDARLSLPEHIFKQEYLAEFLDDGSAVFRNINDCIETGVESGRYYAGVDLGRADDYTVLTIVDENDREVYCERWRQQEWSAMIDKMVVQLNKYKAITKVECNGTQDAIYEQIRNKVNYSKGNIQPFITTNKSKAGIIEDLAVKFEQMDLGIMGHDFQLHELGVFTYEYNPRTRVIKYSAPTGLHDDYVMSRALASHALKCGKLSGVYQLR